ncbi:MAG: Glu-tRNA(Gln) amidotransferase subunit GatE [Nanoarchaeota archaeon]|nr:Glu-tRNA(Gln) amidotransferase subunit GatE [Nanoarchaeota archaeon]
MVEIKSGIEIHQQLNTHKLFCNCPSILRNDEPNVIIKRKLHAVAGESGEIDAAAIHEATLDKEFIYQGYDTTCLFELDECPPHLINPEALKIALHIALFLNCEILPITQIMRKTVVNGSNTSGFQRTVLIARNGYVETVHGRVGIETVFLEEDAAREIGKEGNKIIFRLDRLGIPLVEIATAPDIKSAEQAKEVALFIGDVLRSCKVKRGIGTIRQDINISIPGHPRVEIKGFQDVKMFIPTIENEVLRQNENLKSGKELKSEVRNSNVDGTTAYLRPMPGSARMYPETDLPLLHISREIINKAKASVPKLRSDIRGNLRNKGLSEEMIKLLSHGDKIEEFESLLKIINDPNFIAKVLFLIPADISSHEKIENINDVLNLDIIESVVNSVASGKISRDDVKHVMERIAKGEKFENAIKLEKADLSEIEGEIAKIVKEKPGLSIGGYMGLIMQKFKGKISGKEASDILQKLLKT